MNWLILILFSVVFYSVATIIQRMAMREDDSDPLAYTIVFQLFVGFLIAIFGILTNQLQVDWVSVIDHWFYFLLAILLYVGFNYFTLSALKKIEAPKYSVILSTRVFFTTIAAALLLSEKLALTQFIGALIIFMAIVVITHTKRGYKFDRYEKYALLAAACFGLANTNDRFLLGTFELYYYTSLTFLFPGTLLLLFAHKKQKEIKKLLEKTKIKRMTAFSVFYAASSVTFFGALQVTDSAPQAVSISLLSVILIAILSIVFLKEKVDIFRTILAAGLSLIGMLLIV